jgi:RNA polymerase sigma factor (sigma-70 family)
MQRSPPSYDDVVRAEWPRLYRAAYHLTFSHADAEDLVQKTFLAGWQSWEKRKGTSCIYTWLYRILLCQWYRDLRRREKERRLRVEPPPITKSSDLIDRVADAHAAPDRQAQQDEELREIFSVVEQLPAQLRAVWCLRHLEGMKIEQIAQCLACSDNTVKSRLRSAYLHMDPKLKHNSIWQRYGHHPALCALLLSALSQLVPVVKSPGPDSSTIQVTASSELTSNTSVPNRDKAA